MVVLPLLPVFRQQGDVQVEARDRCLALANLLYCALAHRDGSQAGRRAQAFLAAAVANINAPFVNEQRLAPKGGHSVHQEDGVYFVGCSPDLFEVLAHAR